MENCVEKRTWPNKKTDGFNGNMDLTQPGLGSTFICVVQVCQIRVMTEFETITLTQDGAVDFKTITVFLFPKFNRQPFFFRDRNLMQCLHSRSPRNKFLNQKIPFYYFIEFDMINPDTFL